MSVYGVSGTVTVSGSALSGATVICVDPTTPLLRVVGTQITDGSGNYQFSGLVNGREYTIMVYDPSGGTSYNAIVYDKVVADVVTPTDSFWDDVLLLVGNDAGTGTTVVDQSKYRRQIANPAGKCEYSLAQAPTGMSTSIAVSKSGAEGKLIAPFSDDFAFGTGDYTFEMMIRLDAVGASFQHFFDMRQGTTFPNELVAGCSSGAGLISFWSSATQISSSAPSATTWHHYADCRASGTARQFLDGTQTGSVASAVSFRASWINIMGGNFFSSWSAVTGYFACFRLTKAARYTSSFTPPTLPLPTN